jgi:hypothetical protein
MLNLAQLPQIVTAIGGLGTAAFGLVDATKAFGGGVNHIGFNGIEKTVTALTPPGGNNALSQAKVLATLKSHWFNGTDLESQKSIAKSLIKLNLNSANAEQIANATGVDSGVLKTITANMAAATPLTSPQSDVYARFDLIVTAMLDETYQRSDNVYRNWTRAIAAAVAVVLAIIAGYAVDKAFPVWQSALVGLLATPLAPIAKDLSTALATAVNTLQQVKK